MLENLAQRTASRLSRARRETIRRNPVVLVNTTVSWMQLFSFLITSILFLGTQTPQIAIG